MTGTGYVVGTAAYLAPEQVRGEWVGPEADVYALGLVLLEALTGRREYPGALVESATARLHRPPGIPDGLPASLHTAVQAMTALDPAARPTAGQVAVLLAAGSAPGPPGRAPPVGGAARVAADRGGGDDPGGRVGGGGGRPAVGGAGPGRRSGPSRSDLVGGVVPSPEASSWVPASAVVPVDRVTATLGEGADAARRRAAAVAKSLTIPQRAARDGRSTRR